jgi:hypothetical protein
MTSSEALVEALKALNSGNFHVSLDESQFQSTDRAIAQEINILLARHKKIMDECERVKTSTTNGYVYTRAVDHDAPGDWSKYTTTLNECLDATTEPIIEMLSTIDAVCRGDLDHQPNPICKPSGELLRVNSSITEMMSMLRHFTVEIERGNSNLDQGSYSKVRFSC